MPLRLHMQHHHHPHPSGKIHHHHNHHMRLPHSLIPSPRHRPLVGRGGGPSHTNCSSWPTRVYVAILPIEVLCYRCHRERFLRVAGFEKPVLLQTVPETNQITEK